MSIPVGWPIDEAESMRIRDRQIRDMAIPVLRPITRCTITPEEALRDRCAELETCIRMAIRAFEGDLAPAIAEAACRDALLP